MKPAGQALTEWKNGWPLPIVAAIGIATFNMPIQSLGVFFEPLEEALGWSRATSASGLFALSAVAVFTIPLAGRLLDQMGARRVALPGIIVFCLAFAGLGLAQSSVWTWWALWVLLGIAAALVSPVVWTGAVASRFDQGRGLALALSLSGAGLATIIGPMLSNWLIADYGWRGAYAGLAALCCIILLPLVVLFFFGAREKAERDEPLRVQSAQPSAPEAVPLREAIRDTRFLRLALTTFMVAVSLLALVVHFVPILTAAGIDRTRAAEAAAVIGIGSISGRLVTGLLLDRIHGRLVGCGIFTIPVVVALALLTLDENSATILIIAFFLGFSLGGEIDIIAYLTSRYFGVKRFGAYFGLIMSSLTLATGVGPLIAGWAYDVVGSYDALIMGAIFPFLMASGLILSLGPYPEAEDDAAEPELADAQA